MSKWKPGDHVRYRKSFLVEKGWDAAANGAELTGTIIHLYVIDGREIAQIDFGSLFRATGTVEVQHLELVTELRT